MQPVLAAATFLAAVAATYFFCVRPMRQGRHCAMTPPTDTNTKTGQTTGVTPEDLKAARAELEALRAAMAGTDNSANAPDAPSSELGQTEPFSTRAPAGWRLPAARTQAAPVRRRAPQ
jgi:hypothetical protein